jgi:Mg-chelatase subunit ChlD
MNVYILLDRSGSMQTMWGEALGSINGYVKKLNKKDKVHLAVFDSVSHDVVRDCTVEKWKDINTEEVSPRGGTPLYDSCGKVMSLAEEADARKTLMVVMTDGFENASHEYTQAAIKAKVESWTDKKWEVVFLGANFDAVESVSNSIGVVGSKTLNYGVGNFARGMDTLMASTMAYASGASINFSDADKQAAAGK